MMRRTRTAAMVVLPVAAMAALLGIGIARSNADAEAFGTESDDEAEVRAAAQAYLDGLLDGDVPILESAFHPETRFQGSVGDAFVGMTLHDWAESRRGKRMRPVEDYRHSIEDVLISGNAAVVRTDIDWPGTYFVDYLSLLNIDDEWKIVNKIWTQRPSPRAMERIENLSVPPDEVSQYEGKFRSEGEDGVELAVTRAGSRLLLGVNGRRYELYFQGDDTFAPEFDVDDGVEFERNEAGRADRLHLVLDDTTIVAERIAVAGCGASSSAGPTGSGPIATADQTADRVSDMVDAAAIDSFVQSAMAELGVVPGVALAAVRDGEVVHEAGYGWRDREQRLPVTPRTVFYTASLAKAFTGATAAVLAADGEIDLDAPLSRFLPGLTDAPPVRADETTLRDLLRHGVLFSNGGVNFVTTFVRPYEHHDLVRILNDYSDPSEGFVYSNTNYVLAGYAIEAATGRDWRDVMRERVFAPLGMERSTARLADVDSADFAFPYLAREDGVRRIPFAKSDRTITGAGGIFSTAGDLARFVVAQLDGGRLDGHEALPAAAVREMQTPQIELDATFFEFERYAYGLGLYLAHWEGEELVHHFGGFPGFRSHVSFMPEHGMGVVVLQNEGVDGNRFADIVAAYVYDRLLDRPDADARGAARLGDLRQAIEARRAQRRDAEATLVRWERSPGVPSLPLDAYAGEYVNERLGTLRIETAGDRLRLVWGDLDAPVLPTDTEAFLVPWVRGFQALTFTFETTEYGEVDRLDWGFRRFVRRR